MLLARVIALGTVATTVCGCMGTNGQSVRTFVRNCDNRVGHGGLTVFSQSQALHVGLLWLGSLRTMPLALLDRAKIGQRRFGAIESIAVIRAGAAVTIFVPASERSYVGLTYDTSKFRDDGAYRIADLDWVVRFEACTDPRFNHGLSQFDGGVVLAGRRCFTLDFYIRGRPGETSRRLPSEACARPPLFTRHRRAASHLTPTPARSRTLARIASVSGT